MPPLAWCRRTPCCSMTASATTLPMANPTPARPNPPILILDEATSALDTNTEQDIKDALQRAGEGRTVLTIAHRLSTVAEADLIVVLEKGEIAEQGSHDMLLAQGGRYAQLWQGQQSDDPASSVG